MTSVNSLPPGADFGEFHVLEQIGRGSMGTVYKVTDRHGVARALKVRPLGLERNRDARRFEREAEAGRQIESPYIAKTLETGTDEALSIDWILMEYAEGVPLSELVEQRGALPRELALAIARQMFDAVSAAHAAGIVHRDLSPANIRVKLDGDEQPVTKVLDFGIAKSTRSRTGAWTKPGLGTPLWVAPEQHLTGYTPSPAGDVWALGLLVFYLLTGRFYWKHAQPGSSSLGDLSMEILRHPIADAGDRAVLLGVADKLPRYFDDWFRLAVARNPDDRYADASEAGSALWEVFADEAPATVRPRPKSGAPEGPASAAPHRGGALSSPEKSSAVEQEAHEPAPNTLAAAPEARSGAYVPSGRVMLLLLTTLLLAAFGLYWVLSSAAI